MNLKKIKIACLGDSLTRGRVSYNWVKQLNSEFKNSAIEFNNQGKDGDLAYNGLQRIQKVLDLSPTIVTIQLGTNDILATSSEELLKRYMKGAKLPQVPTKEWYIENISLIVQQLRGCDIDHILLITIPILGEDLNSEINRTVADYNAALKQLAQVQALELLDFHQEMVNFLQSIKDKEMLGHQKGLVLMTKAIFRKYLLCQNWNTISEINGLFLLTDTIHLNQRSGEMLVGLIKKWIEENVVCGGGIDVNR